MSAPFQVDSRQIFAIAGPAMLANLTTPLLGIVATAVIGRLGEASLLGGVAMASVAFDCVFWLFGFLRMGTVAFTAQALGANDTLEMRAVLARALLLSVVIGAALLALQVPLASLIFGLMGGSEAVQSAAKTYFHIRLWAAPFVLANYAMLGWLVGQARARLALAIQVTINLVNIAATTSLVLGFGMGVAGAAAAAIVAEALGLVMGIAIAWRLLGGRIDLPRGVLLDRTKLMHMLAVNRDIMIRTAALIGAFLLFTSFSARAGDVTLAANAVLNNFIMIGSFFLDGLANAAEQLCGRSFGARDRANFSRAMRLALTWGFSFGAAVSVAFFICGGVLIDAMTTSADVRATARDFMWLAALAPVCGVLAYCYDGIYIGATWARDMRNLMIAAFAIYLTALWLSTPLGNTGLWLSLLLFLMARGLLQMVRTPSLLRNTFPAADFKPASLPP